MTTTSGRALSDEVPAAKSAFDALLSPRSVAVIGASEGTRLGAVILTLLQRHGYAGAIYPINPKYVEVQGLTCYPDIESITADDPVDLAILFVPAAAVNELLVRCGERGVRAAVVISSGFAEVDAQGADLQQEMTRIAATYGMAVTGPNCAGIANFTTNLVAYGTTNFIELKTILAGDVALLTASGGFGNTVFTYCQERALGLSHLIGLGNEAVTDATSILDALIEDDAVSMILANLEAIRRPAAFLKAADRAAALGKPIVVLKAGRSDAGQRAVTTHTAALAGSPAAFAGAFRQHGVIQVFDLDQLADVAMLLKRSPPIAGDRLGILSLAGGGTGLLSDVGADFGFTVPELEASTVTALHEILPPIAVVRNPLDPTAGFARDPAKFQQALTAFAADPNIDTVVFFPLASQKSYAEQLAKTLIDARGFIDKPLIVIWTAGQDLASGAWRLLHEAGIPLFTSATSAFRTLRLARDYRDFVRRRAEPDAPSFEAADASFDLCADQAALERFGVRFPHFRTVATARDAVAAIAEIGEAAFKVHSPDILHKTEVGGVRLGITGEAEASLAFQEIIDSARRHAPHARIAGVDVQEMVAPGLEVLIGVHTDDQLGPILTVGMGGTFTEVLRDVAQRPVPISRVDAALMLDELRASAVFEGFRGAPPYDRDAVLDAMLSVSALADTVRDRRPEIEINPFVVHERGRGGVAVDSVVLFD